MKGKEQITFSGLFEESKQIYSLSLNLLALPFIKFEYLCMQ